MQGQEHSMKARQVNSRSESGVRTEMSAAEPATDGRSEGVLHQPSGARGQVSNLGTSHTRSDAFGSIAGHHSRGGSIRPKAEGSLPPMGLATVLETFIHRHSATRWCRRCLDGAGWGTQVAMISPSADGCRSRASQLRVFSTLPPSGGVSGGCRQFLEGGFPSAGTWCSWSH